VEAVSETCDFVSALGCGCGCDCDCEDGLDPGLDCCSGDGGGGGGGDGGVGGDDGHGGPGPHANGHQTPGFVSAGTSGAHCDRYRGDVIANACGRTVLRFQTVKRRNHRVYARGDLMPTYCVVSTVSSTTETRRR